MCEGFYFERFVVLDEQQRETLSIFCCSCQRDANCCANRLLLKSFIQTLTLASVHTCTEENLVLPALAVPLQTLHGVHRGFGVLVPRLTMHNQVDHMAGSCCLGDRGRPRTPNVPQSSRSENWIQQLPRC